MHCIYRQHCQHILCLVKMIGLDNVGYKWVCDDPTFWQNECAVAMTITFTEEVKHIEPLLYVTI